MRTKRKFHSGTRIMGAALTGFTVIMLAGCAHTYVASVASSNLGEKWKQVINEQYTGVWKSLKHDEKWYFIDSNPDYLSIGILIEDANGRTGGLNSTTFKSAEGHEIMFMTGALEGSMDLSVIFMGFSGDQPTVVPIYGIYLVERKDEQLVLSDLRPGWVKKQAEKEEGGLIFHEIENVVLITSPPEVIVDLLEEQEDYHAAFRKFRVLKYAGMLP